MTDRTTGLRNEEEGTCRGCGAPRRQARGWTSFDVVNKIRSADRDPEGGTCRNAGSDGDGSADRLHGAEDEGARRSFMGLDKEYEAR